ncbi:hypothetical protein ABKA04_007231 [Annulohypoxylon sp. FPYF3050]
MSRQLSVEDFQIAIICALKVEGDAVEDVFDKFLEEGDSVPMLNKAQWDTNIYTTGVIGHHNVVLAHMPNYGTCNSATVAANLRHTFPAVRVAFVVGVCGGMPKIKDNDIMLGDVIISTEVIQYGFGREHSYQFRPIDPIGSEPSSELKSYLVKMQAGTKESSKPSGTVLVPESLKPEVYFGRFGSADKVMKSSTERDRLAKEFSIVALEMEGGGTWEKIPCFIIKGVCDYSDSHKNKAWQPYAAATAACCFKAFLVPWRESVNMNRLQTTRDADGGADPGTLELIRGLFVLDPRLVRNQIEIDNGNVLPSTGSWLFNPPVGTSEEAKANLQDLQSPCSIFNKWWTDDQPQVLWIRGDPVVLIAFRPLTLKEIAVAADLPEHYRVYERSIQDCVELCGSFLNIQKGTGLVTLVHQSVGDYLTPRIFDSTQDANQIRRSFFTHISTFPMATYAIIRWATHGRAASPELGLALNDIKMLDEFLPKWLDSLRWARNYGIKGYEKSTTSYLLPENDILLISCYTGVPQLVDIILGNGETDEDNISLGLHHAVHGGFEEIAEMLIRRKANVNFSPPRSFGKTALHLAVQYGYKGMTRLLIQAGADVNSKDVDGETPLRQAVDNIDVTIASLLIRNGASVSIADFEGHTLLHVAAAGGILTLHNSLSLMNSRDKAWIQPYSAVTAQEDPGAKKRVKEQYRDQSYEKIIKLLIGQQANLVSAVDKNRFTPLHWAAIGNYEFVVQLLIDSGADVNATDNYGWTPLHWAAFKDMKAMTRKLLKNGGALNLADMSGRTALHWVTKKGYTGMVGLLLEEGANVNALDKFSGATALHLAVHSRRVNIVLLLLKHHANPNVHCRAPKVMFKNFKMDEAPYLESVNHCLEIISMKDRRLLENQVMVRSTAIAGSPLHWANKEIAELLLENGADPNFQERQFGLSPLVIAVARVSQRDTSPVDLLLHEYADLNFKEKFGTELFFAEAPRQDTALVELLLQKGADPNLRDKFGRTALLFAREVKAMEVLLKHGANVNVTRNNGMTLLHIAAWHFKTDWVKLFLSNGANPFAKDRLGLSPLRRLELRMLEMEKRDLELSELEKDSEREAWKPALENIMEMLEMDKRGLKLSESKKDSKREAWKPAFEKIKEMLEQGSNLLASRSQTRSQLALEFRRDKEPDPQTKQLMQNEAAAFSNSDLSVPSAKLPDAATLTSCHLKKQLRATAYVNLPATGVRIPSSPNSDARTRQLRRKLP